MSGYFSKGVWIEKPTWKPKPVTMIDIDRRLCIIERIVGSSCRIHADIHVKDNSEVIVCGVLNGQDYVRKFDVPDDSLPELIKMLKELKQVVRLGYIDKPFGLYFGL
jgi:hypothetical protein